MLFRSVSDDLDWAHEMEDVSSSRASRLPKDAKNSPHRTRTRTAHARQASASLNDLHASRQNGHAGAPEERDSVELDSGPFKTQSPSTEPRTPTHRHRRSSSGKSQHGSTPGSGSASGSSKGRAKQKQVVPYVGTEAAVEWGSPKGTSLVRTAQLEPSPGMQLPLVSRRTKSTDS